MHAKHYLPEKYKTAIGASKRLSFERAMHKADVAQGRAKFPLVFAIEEIDGNFRIMKQRISEK